LPLRIGLFGNICNSLYQVGKALRRRTDFDVRLFIDRCTDLQLRPESDDPELEVSDSPWIHRGDFDGMRARIAPWRSPLVKALSECDLALVSDLGPLYAQFTRTPSVFLVTGSDLTVTPFPPDFYFNYPKLKTKLGWTWLGYWQRRGIRKVTEIWSYPFSPYIRALERLRISPRKVAPIHPPLLIDTRKLTHDAEARESPNRITQEILRQFDFVVFHPSRLMIRSNWRLRATGTWKQNDLLIRGFSRFLARSKTERAVLVMPDRFHSPDIEVAKRLISQLGIERNVLWLKPPRPSGFTRDEMIPLYSIADVVADDFGIGWFGAIVLEALAIRRPVISYVDESAVGKLYPWHPVLSANTSEGIADHLLRLYADPGYRRERGDAGRKWIEEFHAEECAGDVYVRHIRDLAARLGLGRTSSPAGCRKLVPSPQLENRLP